MSFESEKPFNDFQHFARGIRRSGDFTINESNLYDGALQGHSQTKDSRRKRVCKADFF